MEEKIKEYDLKGPEKFKIRWEEPILFEIGISKTELTGGNGGDASGYTS